MHEIDNAEWVEKVVAGLPYAGLSVKQGLDGSGFRNLDPADASWQGTGRAGRPFGGGSKWLFAFDLTEFASVGRDSM